MQIIREVVDENGWQSSQLAVQPNHAHRFIRSHPYTVPSALPLLTKGRNSHLLHEEFPHLRKRASLETRSYFLNTAGNVSQEIIQRCLERQSKT